MEQKDWLHIILSAIGGAITSMIAMFAWFGKKLKSYDERIAELESSHRVQVEQHKSNKENMERITDELVNLDNKQDRQTDTIMHALGKIAAQGKP